MANIIPTSFIPTNVRQYHTNPDWISPFSPAKDLRQPKIYARKITTLENPSKAQNFFNTHSIPACQSAVF
jgi:hypothetical protein